MAWFRKTQAPPVAGGKIDNLLGANSSYEGILRSDGNIRIDGVYRGRIETAGNVILGPSARVLADIVAHVVQVWGSVQGNIKTQGRLEILANGRVWGDIDVGALLIDEGGMFRGQCLMAGQNVEEPPRDDAKSEPNDAIPDAATDASEAPGELAQPEAPHGEPPQPEAPREEPPQEERLDPSLQTPLSKPSPRPRRRA